MKFFQILDGPYPHSEEQPSSSPRFPWKLYLALFVFFLVAIAAPAAPHRVQMFNSDSTAIGVLIRQRNPYHADFIREFNVNLAPGETRVEYLSSDTQDYELYVNGAFQRTWEAVEEDKVHVLYWTGSSLVTTGLGKRWAHDGDGAPLTYGRQVELFLYGFFAMMAWELFGLLWRTFKNNLSNSIP